MLKQLYYCSAKCDENQLVSYATVVVHFIGEDVQLYAYRSNTTLSHIRKYVMWLREEGEWRKAELLQKAYRYAIDNGLCSVLANKDMVAAL